MLEISREDIGVQLQAIVGKDAPDFLGALQREIEQVIDNTLQRIEAVLKRDPTTSTKTIVTFAAKDWIINQTYNAYAQFMLEQKYTPMSQDKFVRVYGVHGSITNLTYWNILKKRYPQWPKIIGLEVTLLGTPKTQRFKIAAITPQLLVILEQVDKVTRRQPVSFNSISP